MTFNRRDLLEILDGKLHPALQENNPAFKDRPKVSYDLLYDEMEAALAFGYQSYWSAERGDRALMVGFLKVRNAIDLMRDYDMHPPKPPAS